MFSGDRFTLEGGYLLLQTDGNLVMYSEDTATIPGQALWSANVTGQDCPPQVCTALFQSDGNFVLYNDGNAYWDSRTNGKGQFLRLQTVSPNVSIIGNNGKLVWPR